jgi:ParB family transcriptional regulator, chromosome partitioning protein
MANTGGLGRGLASLIPSRPAQVSEVEIGLVTPNPAQVRTQFDTGKLEELAASIRRHGLLQPLLVREIPPSERQGTEARYQIVAGERRWRAARMAGMERIPIVIRDAPGAQATELALVENLQRTDLNPLEEAAAYRRLVTEHGMTQEQVAIRVGKSPPTVSNALRLLHLPGSVQQRLMSGDLSEGHARNLLGLPQGAAVQEAAMVAIIEQGLSVRQAETLVSRLRSMSEVEALAILRPAPASPREEQPEPDVETRAIERQFEEALGTKVKLLRRGKGGRLIIHFYSEEELQGIYDILVR